MTTTPPPTAPPTVPSTITPPAAPPSSPSGPPPAGGPRRTATGKRGQGELRRQVAALLAADPTVIYTAGEVARALSSPGERVSAGAVRNALGVLTAAGAADALPGRPAAFRATATTGTHITPTAAPTRPARTRPATPAAPPTDGAPATPAASTPAAPTGSGTVVRPNGQTYRPRALADLPDVAALNRLRAAGIPALLYGPPGTGKTSLIEAAFPDLITVAGDGDTAVADFVGEYVQADGGGYEFQPGPLIQAMREGRCLFIDDATLISPKVLAVVYPAMDGRRQVTVKALGQTVTAADGFYVVAGHNPGVHGAVLTDALASRFSAQIRVSTDYDLATALKIDSRAVKVARNLSARHARGDIGWAPQLRELIAFGKIAAVLGTDAAMSNLVGIAPEEDRDVVADTVARVYGRPTTPLALGRQV